LNKLPITENQQLTLKTKDKSNHKWTQSTNLKAKDKSNHK
jgi:hypothetical protein